MKTPEEVKDQVAMLVMRFTEIYATSQVSEYKERLGSIKRYNELSNYWTTSLTLNSNEYNR